MENSIVTRDLSIGYDGTIIVPSLNSEIHRGKLRRLSARTAAENRPY